jgi:hypothetical protein
MHTPLGDLAPPLSSHARSALRTDALVTRQPAPNASHALLPDPFDVTSLELRLHRHRRYQDHRALLETARPLITQPFLPMT